jgi:alpha-methylacyl-CoA racemase
MSAPALPPSSHPPRPAEGLLTGISVLDLSTVGPAARCGRLLSDYGATVIKVGAPARARARDAHLAFHAYSGHRDMRRIEIDLRSNAGVSVFLRMASNADVVIESFRPGVVDRLGVGYAAVREVNPGIVYCSTTGYGQSGPHAKRAGHDVNYLAVGGYLHTSGRREDGAPTLPGATVADIAAGGMHAAAAILAALVGRDRSSEGAYLDVSVADGVAWMQSLYIDEHLATGASPAPGHNILTGRYACYAIYGCADASTEADGPDERGYVAVGAIEPQFWANLCQALGLERWIEHQNDDASQDAIRADLAAAFATRTRDEWVELLADADCCVSPVNDIAEAVADPQLLARGGIVEAKHPVSGTFRQLGPVLAGSGPRRPVYELPDMAANHTDELLAAAGYSIDEIAELHAEGAVS